MTSFKAKRFQTDSIRRCSGLKVRSVRLGLVLSLAVRTDLFTSTHCSPRMKLLIRHGRRGGCWLHNRLVINMEGDMEGEPLPPPRRFSHLIFKQKPAGLFIVRLRKSDGLNVTKDVSQSWRAKRKLRKRWWQRGWGGGGVRSGCADRLLKQQPALLAPSLVNAKLKWGEETDNPIAASQLEHGATPPRALRDARVRFVGRKRSYWF